MGNQMEIIVNFVFCYLRLWQVAPHITLHVFSQYTLGSPKPRDTGAKLPGTIEMNYTLVNDHLYFQPWDVSKVPLYDV
jgi:hypothetical protein